MTVYVSSTNTWWNVEGSGVNGRYYWKDSSLDNRYRNWYSCDRFNRCFLLWFIFRIGFIPLVIEWIELSTRKHKNLTGFPSFFVWFKREGPVEFLRIILVFRLNEKSLFCRFKKLHALVMLLKNELHWLIQNTPSLAVCIRTFISKLEERKNKESLNFLMI